MRYDRQIILPQIGEKGQKELFGKTVLIVGVGALGTVCADLLARAGVGTLVLVDHDIIEDCNLQRVALFSDKDLLKPKALTAKEKLSSINPDVTVVAHDRPFSEGDLEKVDLVLDCTDNLEVRYLINSACKQGPPGIIE